MKLVLARFEEYLKKQPVTDTGRHFVGGVLTVGDLKVLGTLRSIDV